MQGSPRDLAVVDHWSASLERSRARRARASSGRARRSVHPTSALAALLDVRDGVRQVRDLADEEPWELSLGRSRARRRARNLHFVPASSRAKRVSLGALAALTVGPAVGLASGHSGHGSPAATGPEPATTTEHVITLSAGSEGRQVKLLQRALGIKADGIYGPETEAAVRSFQASRGLTVDGVFGPLTNKALRSALANNALMSDFKAPIPGAGTTPAGTAAPATLEALAGEQATSSTTQPASSSGEGDGGTSATGAAVVENVATSESASGGTGAPQPATASSAGASGGESTATGATAAGGASTSGGAGAAGGESAAGGEEDGAPSPEAVGELQAALHLPVNGEFDPETEAAVRRLQVRNGLTPDGVVGPATWNVIGVQDKETLTPPPSTSADGETAIAAANETLAIEQLQAALHLQVDGDFGPETEAAVRRLQARNGLTVDGIVGPQTWHAIGVESQETLTPPPSALPAPAPQQEPAQAPQQEPAQATNATGLTPGSGGTPNPVQTAPVSPASAVEWLQAALHLPVDGEFGPETEAAVRRLQARHGIAVDGVVGPQTWALIGVQDAPTLTPPASALLSSTPIGAPGAVTSTGGAGGEGEAEAIVARVIAAADEIATRPYVYGGGHGSFESYGYDCSGSVSYALHGGGLLASPEDSGELESYGEAGPGRYITIYANAEHAYMVIDGKRFDTVALAEDGSRWSDSPGDDGGAFVERHPDGL